MTDDESAIAAFQELRCPDCGSSLIIGTKNEKCEDWVYACVRCGVVFIQTIGPFVEASEP